jgi:Domain of unknown function (DUF5668)/B-box zinc finger
MNCAKHTEVPATAFCRTCGKALCGECTRDVRGVIYCEGCIAERLSGTLPSGTPAAMPVENIHPGLAALLGFIPGVGAVYNGQAGKGFLHLIAFVTLIAISKEVGPITVPIWFFFVGYMVVDAHKTAKARKYGQPLPDWFGLNNVFGHQTPVTVAAPTATYAQPNPNVYQAGVAAQAAPVYYEEQPAPTRSSNVPIGAIILIGLGFLFLLQNVGMLRFYWIGKLWPLILIAVGVNMFLRRNSWRADRS